MRATAPASLIIALTLTGTALASPPEPPQAPDPVGACYEAADTQQAMNACAKRDAEAADETLAAAVAALEGRSDAHGRRLLRAALASFRAHRATLCQLEADTYRGGTMAPMIAHACHATQTRAFARSLDHVRDLR